jgi:hypothetical protein
MAYPELLGHGQAVRVVLFSQPLEKYILLLLELGQLGLKIKKGFINFSSILSRDKKTLGKKRERERKVWLIQEGFGCVRKKLERKKLRK